MSVILKPKYKNEGLIASFRVHIEYKCSKGGFKIL